jgi:hypothetical protein
MTAEAIVEQQEIKDTEISDLALGISDLFEGAFSSLIARRNERYNAAIQPLDAEREALEQESAAIGVAARSLELLLPAKARIAQHEADELLVAGKPAEAAAKVREMREAQRAPEDMKTRQREISARIEAIQEAKRAAAHRIFETWHGDCQAIIRAAEHGLFITLLEGLRDSFWEFQTITDTAAKVVGGRELFTVGHLTSLTADENSPEWLAGNKFYRGRR